MKMIHEMRRQQTWEASRSSSPLPIILGAVIAFGIGLLGVSGVVRVPTLLQAKTQLLQVAPRDAARPAQPAIDPGVRRIGSAEAAPLLKVCVPFTRLGFGREVETGELYRVLQSASGMSRVAALAGIRQKAIDDAQFAAIWADIADCVYRQNGWVMCDPDNRAFAVEAASTFIRQLATAERTEKFVDNRNARPFGLNGEQRAYALQNANAVKGRVLSGIRAQVAEGRLVASDFGMLVPSEITRTVRETRASRDACAARN
jgi:hypothetical protein